MKILLLIALVIVGSSQILARPGLRWWIDDSVEYSEDYDPNMDVGETNDDVAVEKSLKDYDGFEKYWSRPVQELYVEETDSTQEMDTSSEEMPWKLGKQFVFKQDKDDKNAYVIVEMDAPSISKNEVNVKNLKDNLYDLTSKSLQAADLKFVAKEEISRVNEPLNSHNYFAYQVTEKKEEANGIKDNIDDDKGVLSSFHIDLSKDDEHKEFVFIEDKQKELDEKYVISSLHKGVSLDYPPLMEPFSLSGWTDGKDFGFIDDKKAAQNEEDMHEEQDKENEEEDAEVVEDEEEYLDNEDNEHDEQDKEDKQDEKDEKHEEDDDKKEPKGDTENEENTESKKTRSSVMGATHVYLNKDLLYSSVAKPIDFHNNLGELLSKFAISPSGSEFLFYEHQANMQDFLMTQDHINGGLKELNAQNERMIETNFLTAHGRTGYNGQLHRDFEREMTEMLQTVDQIKGRIIQMQQIEQKHNYHMLLDALRLELNGKSK